MNSGEDTSGSTGHEVDRLFIEWCGQASVESLRRRYRFLMQLEECETWKLIVVERAMVRALDREESALEKKV